MKIRKTHCLLAVVLIFGFLLFGSQTCFAAQGSLINVPGSAFVPDGGVTSGQHYKPFMGGYLYYNGAAETTGCYVAPVNFPQGSTTIDKVTFFVLDANPSDHATLTLIRVNLATGVTDMIGSITTSDAVGIARHNLPNLANTAVSAVYSYYLTACMPPNVRLYGVKVKYSAP